MAIGTAAIIGAGVSAIGSGLNFIQAGKARRDAEKASDKAGKALEEARDKLQVNYLRGLSIQKEPYELAREAGIATGAQIVQAAQEGEQRGVVAGASRAALAAQQMQNQNRIAMGQELQGLQRAAANEDRNLQRQLSNLDLQEARGFQNMAADARARQRELNQAGAQGLISTGTQAMKSAPLYGDTNPNQTNLLGFNTGDTFDPTNASFEKTQRVFNPSGTARFLGAELPSVSNITTQPELIQFEPILPTADPTIMRN